MSALHKFREKHGGKTEEPMKRVATVAVMHGDHLLMGKRRDNQKWTTPGGHLESGEDFLAGAVRELEEESGIKAEDGQIHAIAQPKTVTKPDGKKIQVQPFLYMVSDRPQTSMTDDPDAEVHRWKWVDTKDGLPEDIAGSLHVPLEDNCLTQALGLKGPEGDKVHKVGKNLEKYMKKNGATDEDILKMHSAPAGDKKGQSPMPEDDYGVPKKKDKKK